ncbi:unnamed protein product, partial [Didymodactylos carnosus]
WNTKKLLYELRSRRDELEKLREEAISRLRSIHNRISLRRKEADAKAFVVQACSQKSGEFKALELAQFINEKYYELTGIKKQIGDDFIRSERSCHLDLRRWEAKSEANSQRPYFEGHERDDVVKHRNEFIGYFLAHKDYYYTITDGEISMWKIPIQNPHRILIFHDESTFRSGEVSPKRWFFGENTPFFS